jgi:hypothetical protein
VFEIIRRSKTAFIAVSLFGFVALGYFSNAISSTACEREALQWVNAQLAAHPSNSPERRAYSNPASFLLPWVVSVDYEWAASSTGAEWGTRHYFTLFGMQFLIRNKLRMVS